MSKHLIAPIKPPTSPHEWRSLTFYLLPTLTVFLADSIMSFLFPLQIERVFGSNTAVGLLLATSSVLGLLCDFVLPRYLAIKDWRLQFVVGVLVALFFPLLIYCGVNLQAMGLLLAASFVWGIYYEFLLFSQQGFIVSTQKRENYSSSWGVLTVATEFVRLIGPVVGGLLLSWSLLRATGFVTGILIFTLLSTSFLFLLKSKTTKENLTLKKRVVSKSMRASAIWLALGRPLAPVLAMYTALELVDATIWTIGALFALDILDSWLSWSVMAVYQVPMLLGAIIVFRLRLKTGKKQLSQLSLMIGGIFLSLCAVANELSPYLSLLVIFLTGWCFSISYPLNDAVASDLIERLDKDISINIVGLTRATTSIAYILGPIIVGIASDQLGYSATFMLVGLLTAVIGGVLLIITPRKIRLPHRQLATLA